MIRPSLLSKQILKRCLFLFLSIFIFPNSVLPENIETDSTENVDVWNNETAYQIGLLRLQRWAKSLPQNVNQPFLTSEVVKLLKEAETFARAGDFFSANLWLESIWGLIEAIDMKDTSELSFSYDKSEPSEGLEPIVTNETQAFVTNWGVQSGVDLWRFKVNFPLAIEDVADLGSTQITESNTSVGLNPFSSVRVELNWKPDKQISLQNNGFLKYSLDYFSGDLTTRFEQRFRRRSRWKIENRFEAAAFQSGVDIQYWQNRSKVSIMPRLGFISFSLSDEATVRKYTKTADNSTTYLDFFNNMFEARMQFHYGYSSLISLGFRNEIRLYPDYNPYNYSQNRFSIRWARATLRGLSIALDNEIRRRNYGNLTAVNQKDETAQIQFLQDFWGLNIGLNVELPFTVKAGLRLRGNLDKRLYELINTSSLPDYTFFEVEPQFYLKFLSGFRVGAGMRYERELYQDLNEIFLASGSQDVTQKINQFDAYFALGPLLRIEFTRLNSIILTLEQTYVQKRYNDNASFYTDRNIYNLLLFLTWDIDSKWQLNLLANFDDDRSIKERSGESQNTLTGLELHYRF